MSDAVLVTGGAGFIGSNTAKALAAAGWRPVVFDSLAGGSRDVVRWGEFVQGDIRDEEALRAAMTAHKVTSVIHLAALTEVGLSMQRPDLFWDHNVAGTASLLRAMVACGVPRLVFSSSAAVYGRGRDLLDESLPTAPVSAYGDTKLAGERLIRDYCSLFGLSATALRYFNAAGAEADGALGERRERETHLIPLAIEAALGFGPPLTVFGDDFPTRDGSGLRDYVHVSDLARAHLAALADPPPAGRFEALNVGAGAGWTVLEVIAAIDRALGRPTPYVIGPRRAGDPAALVADPRRIRDRLGWRATESDLHHIVETAVRWRREANQPFPARVWPGALSKP